MKQNFRKNFKKCQLPIITINFLGIKINFLVDSGSSKNQISGAAFKILKETDLYKENFADCQGKNKVSGVGGKPSFSHRYYWATIWTVENMQMYLVFFLTPSSNVLRRNLAL